MKVRPEQAADREAIRDIHSQAFGDHGLAVADLADALRKLVTSDVGISLVAEEGRLVGHVMLTTSLLDAPSHLVDVYVLGPLGVLPGEQGKGIGSALVQLALDMAAEQDVPLVFLEGDPTFYRRFGFSAGHPLGFRKPSLRIPDGAFQVLRLPSYASWMDGTLVYSHIFWDHDSVGLRGGRLAAAEGRDVQSGK